MLPSLQCTLPFGDWHVKLYLYSHTQSIYLFILFRKLCLLQNLKKRKRMTNTVYTETKNNKYLIRQGCHDSGAQSLKKYVKNSKATYANKNNYEDEQTCHVKRYIPSCYF